MNKIIEINLNEIIAVTGGGKHKKDRRRRAAHAHAAASSAAPATTATAVGYTAPIATLVLCNLPTITKDPTPAASTFTGAAASFDPFFYPG